MRVGGRGLDGRPMTGMPVAHHVRHSTARVRLAAVWLVAANASVTGQQRDEPVAAVLADGLVLPQSLHE